MFAKKSLLRFLAILFLIFSACSQIPSLELVDLQTEGRNAPLGIDRTQARFTWKIKTEGQDVEQTAYQILVATDPSLLAEGSVDLWDSEKIVSAQSDMTVYKGVPLTSGMEVYWKVRIWDADDQPSSWSQ